MIFVETKLPGVFEIRLERKADDRGFFARSWCRQEFESHGLNSRLEQCSVSFSSRKGTLRGMHWQESPSAECKLIRCTHGAIYDVAVDLRPDSPSFLQWVAVNLTAADRNMIFIPEGCAHGHLTLDDDSEVFYQISESYNPAAGRGFRWNDPAFGIVWPAELRVISKRDRTWPDFHFTR